MTRIWDEGVAIRMETDAGSRPCRFFWGGRWHPIAQIVQRWQIDSDWWESAGRVWRDYFAAITADGLLVAIYYDYLSAEWRLAKLYD